MQSNIIIYLEFCFWPPDECKSIIHSLLALVLVSLSPVGNICIFSCALLPYVHQLVAYWVCLLFGAEQALCRVFFFRAFVAENSCHAATESDAIRMVRVNLNRKVVGRTDKQLAETNHKAT